MHALDPDRGGAISGSAEWGSAASLGGVQWVLFGVGPEANRHDKPLIHMPLEGSCFGVDSHASEAARQHAMSFD